MDKARRLVAEQSVQVDMRRPTATVSTGPKPAYDGVAAIAVQFAAPASRGRPFGLFAHIVRSLKPGGTLLLQGYTPRQLEHKTGGPTVLSPLTTEPRLLGAHPAGVSAALTRGRARLQLGSNFGNRGCGVHPGPSRVRWPGPGGAVSWPGSQARGAAS